MIDPNELMSKINDKIKVMLGEQAMQIAIQAAQIEQLQRQLADATAEKEGKVKSNGNLPNDLNLGPRNSKQNA